MLQSVYRRITLSVGSGPITKPSTTTLPLQLNYDNSRDCASNVLEIKEKHFLTLTNEAAFV